MRIAVNTRFLNGPQPEGYGYFIRQTFTRMAARHPEDEFIFLFDRPVDRELSFGKNVRTVVTGPQARHPLLWKFWYDFKVPSLLKKYKADVFVSPDGFCSLRTSVPQCLVIHDLAFIHYPAFQKRGHLSYYKKNTPKFLRKANRIATVSSFSKNDIITQYGIDGNMIDVVYSAAKDIFCPSGVESKQLVKEKYSDGREYFLYAGAIHPRKNVLHLLKGFSLFKKRMQTNMKLVLAGRLAWKYENFTESLKSYKYRDDVVLTGYLPEEELAGLMGAAYGLVYPSLFEGFGVPVLEAMQAGVPVITSDHSSMKEIAGDAALYVEPEDIGDIGNKMMMLYKDERLKKELIEKGLIRANDYSWDKTADLLWESIIHALA